MPNDSMPLTGELKVGDSMKIESSPSKEVSTTGGEETSAATKNVDVSQPAEEAVTDEKSKAFVSGGKKARELGESRKKLAKTLLEAAKSSQEVRQQVKQLAAESPELEKYIQKYFSKDYQVIFKDRLEKEVEEEELKTSDREKMKARAELLIEDIRAEKVEQAEDLAARLHFTRKEANELKDLAFTLEGKSLGDEELNFEEALKRAALTIAPPKARVGITSLPSGMPSGEVEQQEIQESKLESLADLAKKYRGAKRQDAMDNLRIVEKGLKNGVFQLPM